MATDLERLNLLLSLRRYAEGEKAAREAIAAEPEWAAGYIYLALFLLNQRRAWEAVEAAQVGVGKDPHDPWGHAVFALANLRVGASRTAWNAARTAIALNPTSPLGRAVEAEIMCDWGHFGDAIATAAEGLRHSPQDEHLLHWKGWAEHRLDRFGEALATADEGLRHHPRSDGLLNVRGISLQTMAEHSWLPWRRLRLHQAADAAYREALRLAPVEKAYQQNRRFNILTARLFVLWRLLPPVTLASVAATLPAMKYCPIPLVYLILFSPVVHLPGYLLLRDGDEPFVLAAPLAWLRLRSGSVSPDEWEAGRWWWGVVIAAWIGTPAVAWLTTLVARLLS
jgi:tetratricopeptide (TPR) repeat protein